MRTVVVAASARSDHGPPVVEVRLHPVEAQQPADVVVEALVVEDEGDLVEAAGVDRADHRLLGNVAEEGDLALQPEGEGPVAAADDEVGLDAPAAQLGDRVLGGLGLLLPRRADVGHQGEVDVADVVAPDVLAELPDGLQEGEDLDVAHRAADLGDDDVDLVAGQAQDALFDLVGDVGDDLDGVAQVVAPPLLGQHRRVDRPGGRRRVAMEVLVDEALVVAEVEVGLTPVLGDEHLAVLRRVHGAGIDVDVGVELLEGDPQAPALEQSTQRRSGEALAQ